jgi:putrescine aminotransferase
MPSIVGGPKITRGSGFRTVDRIAARCNARAVAQGSGSCDTRFWHPFADMGSVRDAEFVLERGEDVWVWDVEGNRYFDGTSSLWYANVGHGRTEIAEAIKQQLGELETYYTFNDVATKPALELAERLTALAPNPHSRVFFGSGGGDALETAAKLARSYWQLTGEPDRVWLIGREFGYHGTHGFGTSLGGIAANRSDWGPLDEHVSIVPHTSVEALAAEIERVGARRVAAFFFEPVIGSGGVHPPAPGYLEGVVDVCRANGVLVVADSVICGFGRLGNWFGVERWSIEPDMIAFAKGVTSGYLPLGGLVVSDRVADPFWREAGGPVFRHGPTYAGHAACCAAALANLDILEREGLLERSRELEPELAAVLAEVGAHPLVAEVRAGVGLLGAMELDLELLEDNPRAPFDLFRLTRMHGALIRPLGTSVAVSPPLTCTTEQLQFLGEALHQALTDLAGAHHTASAMPECR